MNLLFVNRTDRYKTDPLFADSNDTQGTAPFFHTQAVTKNDKIKAIRQAFTGSPRADFERERFGAWAQKQHSKSVDEFITEFKNLIQSQELYGANWLAPLENIGDPKSTAGLEVHYPLNPEPMPPDAPADLPFKESFKWWMRNAGKEKGYTGSKKSLPTTPGKPGEKAPVLPKNPIT
ncbi:MAG: hypothetical protein HQK60_11905 [Deltaproteobacteria bacterium]|nr:hypothetical protein [Deltaproteobacteria bacterium]